VVSQSVYLPGGGKKLQEPRLGTSATLFLPESPGTNSASFMPLLPVVDGDSSREEKELVPFRASPWPVLHFLRKENSFHSL
jgi:hypothetical protein